MRKFWIVATKAETDLCSEVKLLKENAAMKTYLSETECTYHTGEKVFHIPEGVCLIEEISRMANFGEEKEYYKLVPVMDKTVTIYVGIDGPAKYMRKLRSKENVQQIITLQQKSNMHWEKDEEKRISQMQTALRSDNAETAAKLIKMYHQRKKQERLSTSDNNLLKKAEQFLYSEFAEVLGVNYKKLCSGALEQPENPRAGKK